MTSLSQLCLAVSIAATSVHAYSQQTPPAASPPTVTSPRPNPDASGRYHVGDGVTAPIPTYSAELGLSKKMIKEHLYGSCVISLTVDIAGNPHDVLFVKSTPDASDKKLRAAVLEMQDQCIKAVKQYRFKPATFNGNPVPVNLNIEISFNVM